jgi:acetoin utilization protein AcuB
MTRLVVVVPPQITLDLAWDVMQKRRIRHLPVVQGGTLLGILSDRDVLVRARLTDDGTISVPSTPVVHAMTPSPATCEPDQSVSSIVRVMTERKIDAMPVLDARERLVGLVTSTDLLLLLIEPDSERPLPFTFTVEEVSSQLSA